MINRYHLYWEILLMSFFSSVPIVDTTCLKSSSNDSLSDFTVSINTCDVGFVFNTYLIMKLSVLLVLFFSLVDSNDPRGRPCK